MLKLLKYLPQIVRYKQSTAAGSRNTLPRCTFHSHFCDFQISTMDKDGAEGTTTSETVTTADTEPKEIEEMDISDVADVVTFSESSSSNHSSSLSQDSFDDDNMSQSSDIRVINEVSGRQVPVTNFDEGKAKIQVPISYNVFFNPVQEFNRDMSIAVLTLFAEDHCRETKSQNFKKKNRKADSTSQNPEITVNLSPGIRYKDGIEILEALSASGLRSIRYALEVPGVKQITANDMSRSAVLNIEDNIEINNVEDLVVTSQSDAVWLMQQQKADNLYFDAIDLDPYGCPSKFLDSAVNAVRDGGLLLVTCTDMAVLAGNAPETCYSKYGAISLRNSACHEMALRIALQSIESHCNRYGRYIVPMLSFSADFYIRLFVKVYSGAQKCKQTLSKLSNVFQCNGCCSLTLQPLGAVKDNGNNQFKFSLPNGPAVGDSCVHCGQRHHMGGPIWNGPIHDKQFVGRLIELTKKSTESFQTGKRMLGMLTVINEELDDVPLYYTLNSLCNRVHCETIPLKDFRSALLNGGFRVSMSHCASNSVKTNAPVSIIWDVLRCWIKTHPVSEKRLADPICANLLKAEPQFNANFDPHPDALPESIKNGLLRYQPNPAPNWGPGCRSRPNILGKREGGKRQSHQNKRKRVHQPSESMGNATNGNKDDILIVTLSDDDSMDCSETAKKPSDDSDDACNRKQRLSNIDSDQDLEIRELVTAANGPPKIIDLDDEEDQEITDAEKSTGASEKVSAETTEQSSGEVVNVESSEVSEIKEVNQSLAVSSPGKLEEDVSSLENGNNLQTIGKNLQESEEEQLKADENQQQSEENLLESEKNPLESDEKSETNALLVSNETNSNIEESSKVAESCKDAQSEDIHAEANESQESAGKIADTAELAGNDKCAEANESQESAGKISDSAEVAENGKTVSLKASSETQPDNKNGSCEEEASKNVDTSNEASSDISQSVDKLQSASEGQKS